MTCERTQHLLWNSHNIVMRCARTIMMSVVERFRNNSWMMYNSSLKMKLLLFVDISPLFIMNILSLWVKSCTSFLKMKLLLFVHISPLFVMRILSLWFKSCTSGHLMHSNSPAPLKKSILSHRLPFNLSAL